MCISTSKMINKHIFQLTHSDFLFLGRCPHDPGKITKISKEFRLNVMYDDTLKFEQTVRRVYLTAVCFIKQTTYFTRQLRFPIRAPGSPVMDATAATSEDGDDHLFISLTRLVVI